VRQDAKAELRVFVDHLSLRRSRIEQALDELAVLQGVAQQRGYLLAGGRGVVVVEDLADARREGVEGRGHWGLLA
jgi:hypothetical protein